MDITYRFDPYQALVSNKPSTPEEALNLLQTGHRQFLEINRRLRAAASGYDEPDEQLVIPISPLQRGLSLVPGAAAPQKPFAVILSCSDSRVPVEDLFQVSANSIFVVRVAGNVVGTEGLGSIAYALNHFRESIRLVIVLGHSGCGAITAAVDSYLELDRIGEIAPNYALRSLVDRMLISVRLADEDGAEQELTKAKMTRATLIESAGYLNAALTAFELRRELGLEIDERIKVMYGAYDLRTTRVQTHPNLHPKNEQTDFLADAPTHSATLRELAAEVTGSFCGIPEINSITDFLLPAITSGAYRFS